MFNQINELYQKFLEIKKMGFIRSVNNYYSGCGLTFESLIGKNVENFELPDFEGIEIKVKKNIKSNNSFANYLTLFSASPDGEYLFEIKRLWETYGYPQKANPQNRCFSGYVNTVRKLFIGKTYKFMLHVDRKKEKIFLNVYDESGNMIDDETSWSFDLLKTKLERKFKLLAVITADYKYIDDYPYYKYSTINFYKLKSFENFIELIETGKIFVSFNVGTYLKSYRAGQIYDHGTEFTIYKDQILRLFDKIEVKEHDFV